MSDISEEVTKEEKASGELETPLAGASDLCSYNNISLPFRGRVARGSDCKASSHSLSVARSRWESSNKRRDTPRRRRVSDKNSRELFSLSLARALARSGYARERATLKAVGIARARGKFTVWCTEFVLCARIYGSMFTKRSMLSTLPRRCRHSGRLRRIAFSMRPHRGNVAPSRRPRGNIPA